MRRTAHPKLINQAFANWPAWVPMPQDEIRNKMLSDLRPGKTEGKKGAHVPPPSSAGTSAQRARRAAERAALLPEVVRMRNLGMFQEQIAAALKISRDRVRVIMTEAGI